jgi:hypothetical protein
VENPDELDTPDADTRTDESHERLHDPGSAEMRQVTAKDVAHNTQESGGNDEDRDSGKSGEDDDEDRESGEDSGEDQDRDEDSDR